MDLEQEIKQYQELIGLSIQKTRRAGKSKGQEMKCHPKPKEFMNVFYARKYRVMQCIDV